MQLIISILLIKFNRTLQTVYDVEAIAQDVDSDWAEDMVVEEEDSGGEDSVRYSL